MPTYLYECPICGEFEHEHSITEELEYCPKCEANNRMDPIRVKRLIAPGGSFILAGGRWAKEGYS